MQTWAETPPDVSVLPLDSVHEPSEPSVNNDDLKIQNSQYLNSGKAAFRPGAATQNSSVMAGVDNTGRFGLFSGRAKLSDEYSATENWNYADVYDLHGAVKLGENAEMSLGRKLENWSDWDSRWQQGEFQPRYMENGLRPRDAGLTGVFVNTHSEHWNTGLGVLPIFIPDFGPHFSVQNNEFASQNPWFHPPASNFVLGSGTGEVRYALNDTSASKIIEHPGLASKIEYHDGGYLARASYAYKPLSSFLLGFPSQVFHSDPSGGYAQLEISPRVVYDRILSLDNEFTFGAWRITGSVAADNPVQNAGPSDWTSQQVGSATIVSGSVSRALEAGGPHAARAEFSFLKVNGGDAADTGFLANASGTHFTRRFEYYEAYSLSFKNEFRSAFYVPLENELRLIYDRMQEGGAITLSSQAQLDRNWRLGLEMDIIGLLTSTGQISDGFLSNYRANSRVGLGASYVF